MSARALHLSSYRLSPIAYLARTLHWPRLVPLANDLGAEATSPHPDDILSANPGVDQRAGVLESSWSPGYPSSDEGHSQAAWDLFHERYRRLMLAAIRRLVPDA